MEKIDERGFFEVIFKDTTELFKYIISLSSLNIFFPFLINALMSSPSKSNVGSSTETALSILNVFLHISIPESSRTLIESN